VLRKIKKGVKLSMDKTNVKNRVSAGRTALLSQIPTKKTFRRLREAFSVWDTPTPKDQLYAPQGRRNKISRNAKLIG